MIHVLPTDQAYTTSPDAGDPSCTCSRCGAKIQEDECPIRAWTQNDQGDVDENSLEYRYCEVCSMNERKFRVTVDLNQSRVRLAEQYNAVIQALNEHTENDGYIRIHTEELQQEIQELRMFMSIICHTFFKDCEEYSNISSEVPEFVDFNPNNY